jgi:hypothetical protein
MNWIRKSVPAIAILALLVFAMPAHGQTYSNTSQVTVTLPISESLTVSATPANVTLANYSYANGTASASSVISVSTTGNLAPGHNWVFTAAWFSSVGAALSGPSNVPSSDLFAAIDGGPATACTAPTDGDVIPGTVSGAICAATTGYNPNLGSISFQQNPAGPYSANDTIQLTLAGAPGLAAGSYVGTLNISAGAF